MDESAWQIRQKDTLMGDCVLPEGYDFRQALTHKGQTHLKAISKDIRSRLKVEEVDVILRFCYLIVGRRHDLNRSDAKILAS